MWSIGIHLSDAIVELSATNRSAAPSSGVLKQRYFLAQATTEHPISQFIKKHSIPSVASVKIVTQLPLKIIESGHGTPTAVVTTSGFENWLELNTPLKTPYFTSRPKRPAMLIDRELIFGISERTNAMGHIQRLVDEKELEFLVSKLELNNIKSVAICFLHSNKNPENELRAAQYFKSRGIETFTSSTFKDHSSDNERSRFWTTIVNAYVAPYFTEFLTKIKTELLPLMTDPSQIFILDQPLSDFLEKRNPPTESATSLVNHLARNYAKTASLLYCGLEDFIFIPCRPADGTHLNLPFGQILASSPVHQRIEPQSLTQLGRSFFSELSFARKKVSLDPGPMTLGRGLRPTLFDIMVFDQKKESLPASLNEKISDRSVKRLEETLIAYARAMSSASNPSATSIVAELLSQAAESWRSEISLQKGQHLLLCGPLSSLIKKYLPGEIIGDDFFTSTSLLVESH